MLFDGKRKAIRKQASSLVQVAKIHATGLSIPSQSALFARFPMLEEPICNDIPKWDLIATGGAVFCGHQVLAWAAASERIPHNLYQAARDQAKNVFEATFGGKTFEVVEDCNRFVAGVLEGYEEDEEQPKFEFFGGPLLGGMFSAVGIWALWNIFGREPAEEEDGAANAVGYMLGVPFTIEVPGGDPFSFWQRVL